MDVIHGIGRARRWVDAAGRLVRHGEINPAWVDNPEEFVHGFGIAGGTLGIAAQGVSSVAQHVMTHGNGGPASNTRSKQTKINFGSKRKRSDSNLRGNQDMSKRRIESTDAAKAAGDPMQTGEAAAAASIPAAGKQHETPITNPPRHIKAGMPEYFTTKHVYSVNHSKTLGAATNDVAADLKIRLNSVYDVLNSEAGQQQPQWRDYFANIYDYYTVLGVEIDIMMHTDGLTQPILMCWNTYGADVPVFTIDGMALRKDLSVNHAYIRPETGQERSWFHFKGHYDHNDYLNKITEIKQDANAQIWTAKASDPALTHNLHLMPRHIFSGSAQVLDYHVHLVYTVQWKESQVAYKFGGQDDG
eukprot:GHVU01134939.1.p1 GENE.GHVU01134939.1~~GHVU01134939.1.p1  ORF type:complete len:359 (-),score=30.16 GHVU01134939.1:62-1138(-)